MVNVTLTMAITLGPWCHTHTVCVCVCVKQQNKHNAHTQAAGSAHGRTRARLGCKASQCNAVRRLMVHPTPPSGTLMHAAHAHTSRRTLLSTVGDACCPNGVHKGEGTAVQRRLRHAAAAASDCNRAYKRLQSDYASDCKATMQATAQPTTKRDGPRQGHKHGTSARALFSSQAPVHCEPLTPHTHARHSLCHVLSDTPATRMQAAARCARLHHSDMTSAGVAPWRR
jgi:hypothetical protein